MKKWLDKDGPLVVATIAAVVVLPLVFYAGTERARGDDYDAARAELASCSSDCSGHYAGHAWASAHNIDSMEDCPRTSVSFHDGCRLFVLEERWRDAHEE